MPDSRLLLCTFCFAASAGPAWAQQVPRNMQVESTTVRSPGVATVVAQTPSTTYQAPNFFGQALGPIKAEIADVRNRMAALDGRENQRNEATIDALQSLSGSSKSQRNALGDIQATLDRIEMRLKKLETAASR